MKSDAIRELHDYLAKSPSVVYPTDVLAFLPAIEAENIKLRKLVRMMWLACKSKGIVGGSYTYPSRNSNAEERVYFKQLMRELGVEMEVK